MSELLSVSEEIYAETLAEKTKLQRNISMLLRQVGQPGFCKGCHAEIFWVTHNNGKKAPYTADGLNHFIDCSKAKRPSTPKAQRLAKVKVIRSGSKKEEVLRMIQRARGATLAELIEFLGWNDKSVRALIGRLGVEVVSEKHETKGRVYRIAA